MHIRGPILRPRSEPDFARLRLAARPLRGLRCDLRVAAALLVALLHTGCLLLPVRIAPAVEGMVVDAASGEPLAGALVVVRFDGRYDNVLPERELIGHLEARTDALGRFRVGPIIRPGVSAWPLFKTEARVVAAMHEGYRCPAPRAVRLPGPVNILLTPALDPADQRDSCRPVPASPGEATVYMAAWRALFPDEVAPEVSETDQQLDRLLAARSTLGFGENCEGPVLDLALAPDCRRAALLVAAPTENEIRIAALPDAGTRTTKLVAHAGDAPPRQLGWASSWKLVLWEPAYEAHHTVSPSAFTGRRTEVVWQAPGAAPPRARVSGRSAAGPSAPLGPDDLNDEGDALWLGRSFALIHSLDLTSGLPRDELRVSREDGTPYTLTLPGEACGPLGRFGRPHYRIVAGGRSGVDLRFVEGGCHAVRINLETGEWWKLDEARGPAVCRGVRTIPAAHLGVALRGYTREVEAALVAAGADTAAAYAFTIGPDGETHVETRDFEGSPRTVPVPRFPVATPLQRLVVSVVGTAPELRGGPAAIPDAEPL